MEENQTGETGKPLRIKVTVSVDLDGIHTEDQLENPEDFEFWARQFAKRFSSHLSSIPYSTALINKES